MSFLNPLGFLALLALPAIAALHLLRERKRRLVVSSLRLWEFLDTDVRGPRTRRLPITWLLALDLLAAALIALALSEPRLLLDLPFSSGRHHVILVDVSTSMRAGDAGAAGLTRFAEAQRQALDILYRSGPGDVVTVVAFGRAASQVGDSREMSREDLADRVRELRAGETGHALQAALAMGEAAVEPEQQAEFSIFTDGAYPDFPEEQVRNFRHQLIWKIMGNRAENQAVVELEATRTPGGRTSVFTRIANFGDHVVGRHVTLLVDGREVGRAQLDLPPNSTLPHSWTLDSQAAGILNTSALTVRLVGSDRLPEDDMATIGLHSGGGTRIALVASSPAPLEQAVNAAQAINPDVELEIFTPENYSASINRDGYDLTIFRGYLPEAWPTGLSLVVEPPTESAAAGLAVSGRREVPASALAQAGADDPLFSRLDFSGVRWTRAWTLGEIPPGFEIVLEAVAPAGESSRGIPLALRGVISDGQERHPVILLLADLERGNFSLHPSFPILVAQLVEEAGLSPLPAEIYAGEPLPLPDSGEYRAVQVQPPAAPAVSLGSEQPGEWRGTLDPGIYRIQIQAEDGDRRELVAGVNAGDPVESDLRARPWARAIAAGVSTTGVGNANSPGETKLGFDLMPWLLFLAVLVMIIEARLAWKAR